MKHSYKLNGIALAIAAVSLSACKVEDAIVAKIDQVDREDIRYIVSGVASRTDSTLTVNGINFDTNNTQFVVDDQSGDLNQIDDGMYVTIEGSISQGGSTGTANKVTFENEVEGMVQANNILLDGTLDVMGQKIIVDQNTLFRSELFAVKQAADIQPSQFVEVSGYPSNDGKIHATRIEVKSDRYLTSNDLEIKGKVNQLTESSFYIGNLEVAYNDAFFKDFDKNQLKQGQYVEVKSVNPPIDNYLAANIVELESENHEQHAAEIEGIVTAINSGSTFELNGNTVYFDGNTYYKDGSFSSLVVGSKVDVDGAYDGNGRFIANEIEFENRGAFSDDSGRNRYDDDRDDYASDEYEAEYEDDERYDRS